MTSILLFKTLYLQQMNLVTLSIKIESLLLFILPMYPNPNSDDEPNNETVLQIGVTDDEINEAMQQYFVVIINVTDIINAEHTTVSRSSSICRIIDNDRKI